MIYVVRCRPSLLDDWEEQLKETLLRHAHTILNEEHAFHVSARRRHVLSDSISKLKIMIDKQWQTTSLSIILSSVSVESLLWTQKDHSENSAHYLPNRLSNPVCLRGVKTTKRLPMMSCSWTRSPTIILGRLSQLRCCREGSDCHSCLGHFA